MSCSEIEFQYPKVAIIGAGLVGSLIACYLVKRGFKVEIYDYRNDIRTKEGKDEKGRSINLALSNRGLKALKNAGISDEMIRPLLIPMYGRFIHSADGKTHILPYDVKYKQCIFSVGRNVLNKFLLAEAEKSLNIKMNFGCRVINVDIYNGAISFININGGGAVLEKKFDLIIGCDGAYSTVRQYMSKIPMFNYSQTYIDHGYLELSIPASATQENQIRSNYLHIWPRVHFMMIALPNQDESWTVTLFMPFKEFSSLSTKEKLLKFFQKNFQDALLLMGEKNLINIFFSSTPQPLIAIKCNEYSINGSKSIILGDAAHAVVPFYGQGMNAGFEDCYIFDEMLEKHNNNIKDAIEDFSNTRVKDAFAISDLSMYNYLEMRDLVLSKKFLLRKMLDNFLYKITDFWTPLYVAVTFSNIPYSQCLKKKKFQDQVLNKIWFGIILTVFSGIGFKLFF